MVSSFDCSICVDVDACQVPASVVIPTETATAEEDTVQEVTEIIEEEDESELVNTYVYVPPPITFSV